MPVNLCQLQPSRDRQRCPKKLSLSQLSATFCRDPSDLEKEHSSHKGHSHEASKASIAQLSHGQTTKAKNSSCSGWSERKAWKRQIDLVSGTYSGYGVVAMEDPFFGRFFQLGAFRNTRQACQAGVSPLGLEAMAAGAV